ncbi:hypothetical protein CI109_107001 [Kwoniella shandongensis]|uniref:Uncharacterized protein n=1 Tax=Kwoniella shandongensis TaxID=1734106 RepID=A0A5M6C628_9TREE|nr:uncharacterized protein CI109_000746 [Kwoniella shandongensis]KAA5530568.1 hypothetical protein CI109_000746 [Kwoniella shandongensis]
MSRPTSSASHHRPSRSGSSSMGGEQMGRVHTFSPTPTASSSHHQVFYPQEQHYIQHGGYPQHQQFDMMGGYGGDMSGQMIAPYAGHQVAQGRMAIPIHGQHGNVMAINSGGRQGKAPMRATPSPSGLDDCGPSPFLPEEETTPYLPAHFDSYDNIAESPSMGHLQLPPNHLVSPTEQMNMARMAPQLMRNNSMPVMNHHPHQQQQFSLPIQRRGPPMQQNRPNMTHRQTMPAPMQRPGGLQRNASLHAPSRSGSPHIAGDIFDPVPAGASDSPLMRQQMHPAPQHDESMDMSWDLASFDTNYSISQGISPARALGPAPMQPQRFSPHREDMMITPQGNKTGYPDHIHSSATSSTATTSSAISSISEASVRSAQQQIKHRNMDSSDDENDSPTRGPSASRAMMKMHLEENKKALAGAIPRPVRLPPKPVTSGGRTSAKFAKVAEDPGVEGVPPGPRPTERPGPSFACIIGQAILRCKAGGLSLEHIYRYVETAYPFFKNGDGAWRNSVRHNLSIHKMFETIPRTEAFPPGKGGIWIIHEEEKCHWPSEDKFIKNFPASHPHHAVCRQTLHERAKEQDAIDKAAKEGKVYIPKKGKKGRKLPVKEEEEDDVEMVRSSSLTEVPLIRTNSQQSFAVPMEASLSQGGESSTTPQMATRTLHPPPLVHHDFSDIPEFDDDDGEFLPMDADESDTTPVDVTLVEQPRNREDSFARQGIMVPPRFERKEKRRQLEADDEGVFTSTKKVRVAEPLAPLHSIPQETVDRDFDDSFITPERERPTANGKIMSSAFKTPALVQTSSSPTSSPMPQTITRSTHHPSALQQAWTHDDMAESNSRDSSPARPMLESAFDFKPKAMRGGRTMAQEDEFVPTSTRHSPRAPPKTPVSRSSAATDKTPRLRHLRTPSLGKTPMFFGGSPALPPPSASALLSTPMWEVGGCLDRLKDHLTGSPTRGSIRSPMPPTSPTRYAMLLDSGASPRKGRDVSL